MQDNYNEGDLTEALKSRSKKIAERQRKTKLAHLNSQSNINKKQIKTNINSNITDNNINANELADALITQYDPTWKKRNKKPYKRPSRLKIWLITTLVKIIVSILALYVGFSLLKGLGINGISDLFNGISTENINNLQDINSSYLNRNEYESNNNSSNMNHNTYGKMPTNLDEVIDTITGTYSEYNQILD